MTDLVAVRTGDGQNYILAKVLRYADGHACNIDKRGE
jgi:hypothetical protein